MVFKMKIQYLKYDGYTYDTIVGADDSFNDGHFLHSCKIVEKLFFYDVYYNKGYYASKTIPYEEKIRIPKFLAVVKWSK